MSPSTREPLAISTRKAATSNSSSSKGSSGSSSVSSQPQSGSTNLAQFAAGGSTLAVAGGAGPTDPAPGGAAAATGAGGTTIVASRSASSEPQSSARSADVIRLRGLVSSPTGGIGRAAGDRQFVLLNGRPVDAPWLVKAAQATWRRYEMKHKPAIVVSMEAPGWAYDVNASVDKREVHVIGTDRVAQSLQ